jgi:hypothetical protein
MATESSRRAKRPGAVMPDERITEIERELEAWRARAVPHASAPLDAEDIARLVRDCFVALGVDGHTGESFSVHTVHYYRRKEILDAPEGRTSAARYALRHVWQAAGARLAGQLGLVTLAEARTKMRGADDDALRRFVASRVADVRARQAARQAGHPVATLEAPRPLRATPVEPRAATVVASAARPASEQQNAVYGALVAPPNIEAAEGYAYPAARSHATARVLPLGGDALCLIPEAHPALRSTYAARALVETLARALGVTFGS